MEKTMENTQWWAWIETCQRLRDDGSHFAAVATITVNLFDIEVERMQGRVPLLHLRSSEPIDFYDGTQVIQVMFSTRWSYDSDQCGNAYALHPHHISKIVFFKAEHPRGDIEETKTVFVRERYLNPGPAVDYWNHAMDLLSNAIKETLDHD